MVVSPVPICDACRAVEQRQPLCSPRGRHFTDAGVYASRRGVGIADSFSATAAAARSASAAMVSVGLAVDPVGNAPAPTRNRFGWLWQRRSRSTTDRRRVVAHTGRTDDVSRTLEVVGVMDFRGAEPREDLVMDPPRRCQPPT